MITDNVWTGKNVKIIGEHSHEGEIGIVEGFEHTLAGWGMRIKLENGGGCFVFKSENLKVI